MDTTLQNESEVVHSLTGTYRPLQLLKSDGRNYTSFGFTFRIMFDNFDFRDG